MSAIYSRPTYSNMIRSHRSCSSSVRSRSQLCDRITRLRRPSSAKCSIKEFREQPVSCGHRDMSYLASITVKDFALVSSETVEFTPGLNVISGASGSGKSVLLQAFGVVLGVQAGKDMIRDPADVAGVFRRRALSPIVVRTERESTPRAHHNHDCYTTGIRNNMLFIFQLSRRPFV
jgi:hypothetical protein